MSTVQDRLSPAQVADACRLYVLRRVKDEGKIAVPAKTMMLGASDVHMMKNDGTVVDNAYDYVMVTFNI